MTPAPQPLWICTNCGFKNNTNPLRCPACGWDEFTIPMTSAPSPSPCEENGCTDIENCDEICDHSRVYSPVQMREAAAQARNQTLDEFLECAFLPGIIHPDSEEGKFLKIIAKKLRTKEQP